MSLSTLQYQALQAQFDQLAAAALLCANELNRVIVKFQGSSILDDSELENQSKASGIVAMVYELVGEPDADDESALIEAREVCFGRGE
ncbi:MAG: hypothetical protein PHF58_10520 [Methylotenera sp.]|nr:hypothetical protein [Methylotenera sp.]